MNTYPVRVGSCLFTMVDPERGHEVAYNRWYERDHFYAGCLVGPWLFAGRRWVATRDLKDLRFPEDSPLAVPVDAGSYLAIYWVHEGRHREHFAWSIDQVVGLYKDGRGFNNRIHAHTVLLHEPWSHYRDDDPVPVELALDHPYQGLAVVAVDPADGTGAEEFNDHLRTVALPELMDGSTVASMVSWRYIDPVGGATERAPMDLGHPSRPAPIAKCRCSSSTATRTRAGIGLGPTPPVWPIPGWVMWCLPHRSCRPSLAPTPTPTSSGKPRYCVNPF